MILGLYQSAAGMLTQMEGHEVIAENLAASSVPGFRRNQASFEAYLNPNGEKGIDPASANLKSGNQLWPPNVPKTHVSTDFSYGKTHADGTTTHFAISGTGFFAVEVPKNGGVAYTRNGTFHLNTQGEMVTADGWKVLSDSGQPLAIPQPNAPFVVNPSGELIQNGASIGKLQISDFSNSARDLRWTGGSYFQVNQNTVKAEAMPADTRVLQGFLESSNVNPMQEMVSMIQATRAYEANQKMLQSQDTSLELVIRQVPGR